MSRVFDLSGSVERNLSGFSIARGGRYEADGLDGLMDRRLEQASNR